MHVCGDCTFLCMCICVRKYVSLCMYIRVNYLLYAFMYV